MTDHSFMTHNTRHVCFFVGWRAFILLFFLTLGYSQMAHIKSFDITAFATDETEQAIIIAIALNHFREVAPDIAVSQKSSYLLSIEITKTEGENFAYHIRGVLSKGYYGNSYIVYWENGWIGFCPTNRWAEIRKETIEKLMDTFLIEWYKSKVGSGINYDWAEKLYQQKFGK